MRKIVAPLLSVRDSFFGTAEDKKPGPNFLGHFTVVIWGCGVACQSLAIVDAKTGEVYFPPELALNAYHMVDTSPTDADAAKRCGKLDPRYAHPFFWGAFICQGDGAPVKL